MYSFLRFPSLLFFKQPYLLIAFLSIVISSFNSVASPFIGEIRIFAGNRAPAGWELCEGQLLSIAENDALYALIGTTYGGDGINTFALPDLRGRVPIHEGTAPDLSAYTMGQSGGTEQEYLSEQQIPSHSHSLNYNTAKGDAITPVNQFFAASSAGMEIYGEFAGTTHESIIADTGMSLSHENRQPHLALNYIISLYGIFPSQNKEVETKFLNIDGSVENKAAKYSEPFLGEIKIFAFNFAPRNWAQCDGQLLPINQNQALFALLGTNYGGNGQTSFALPDIRGRAPVHFGQGSGLSSWAIGQKKGSEQHILSINEIPSHNHHISAVNAEGDSDEPAGRLPALASSGIPAYSDKISNQTTENINTTGGSQAHNNLQPHIALNYSISLSGIFPSPNKQERGSEPFLGEISIFAFTFAPSGYAFCNGQLLSIAQNTALFSIVGIIYGGNGMQNFALPDLQGRIAIQAGQGNGLTNYPLGTKAGQESVILTIDQLPTHAHSLKISQLAISDKMPQNTIASHPGAYKAAFPDASLNENTIGITGGNQPHNNLMPSLGLSFSIALQGIYPSYP